MKSREYRLEVAMHIAQHSKARVAFFCGTYQSAKAAFDYVRSHGGHLGTISRHDMSLKMKTGGELKIRFIDPSSQNDHAGTQVTHAFVLDEEVDYSCLAFLRCRVRTTETDFTYRPGMYLRYGAEVTINY